MARTAAKRVGWRFYRHPTRLVVLGVASSLAAAAALAAVSVSTRHSANFDAGSLSIQAEPSSRTVTPGFTAHYAVKVARRHSGPIGLSGRTDLRVAGELPAGAVVSFTPQRGVTSSKTSRRTTTLTVTTASSTPTGTYPLRVGAHRPHRSGSTAISLIVSDTTSAEASRPPSSSHPVTAPDAFTITAALLDPLAPDMGEPLDLTLTNLESMDLLISSLAVHVASVDAPQSDPTHTCGSSDFSVEQFSGPREFTLPASSTSSLGELGFAPTEWPRVSMLDLPVNQDGCKQASLTFSLAGTVRKDTP